MGDLEPAQTDPLHRAAVRRLFEDTRRRLVETGTRNRLIHVNRKSSRSNVLDIINERSDDVYRMLSTERRTMRFLATGRDKSEDSDTPALAIVDAAAFDQVRYTDVLLETRLGPDALQKRLLKLARDARTAEEEQGTNILYLALGFLTWYEDNNSVVVREAPLILLPVELIRNARTSTYDIRLRDDEVVTNLPLQERLKADFGIRIPDIAFDDDWNPSRYFNSVAEVIATRARWSIDRDGMQLGFFSFAKLLMFHDLDPEHWPDNRLEGHELTRGLLYEGFEREEPMFGAEDKLDQRLKPHEIFHVVDADASQAKVIEEVRSGRNLVVQGPPGTGKSQTIANIIAAAVKDGKRVLFVAEKMAALSVVHDRLVKVGLEDICLELHSRSANKKAVLAELARTLGMSQAVPTMPPEPDRLQEERDRLNGIAEHLHRAVGNSGDSAFTALAEQVRFIGRGAAAPKLAGDSLSRIPRPEAQRLASAVRSYGEALEEAGSPSEHPFSGVGRCDLQPTDIGRLEVHLQEAAMAASSLADAIGEAATNLGIAIPAEPLSVPVLIDQLQRLVSPPDVDDAVLVGLIALASKVRLREALSAGTAWRQAREELIGTFAEAAWGTDPTPLRAPIAAGQGSVFTRWGSRYRGASRELAGLMIEPLPKSAAERTELVDRLMSVRSLERTWREDEAWVAAALGEAWRGERTPFSELLAALDWSDRVASGALDVDSGSTVRLARVPGKLAALLTGLRETAQSASERLAAVSDALQLTDEDADLRRLAARFEAMAASTDRYEEWARLTRLRQTLGSEPLAPLLALMDTGALDGDSAATEFLFARAEAIWKRALESDSTIASLRELDRHELVRRFAALEAERLRDSVKLIRAGHLKQVPQGARGAMGVLRSEFARRRGHMPLRKLFTQAAEAIQRIKPVLLMSPISVAQFLPPGTIKFDLLLIDEASQVRPEDALGAIARADQIVVVGDQKQLPPSAFFDRLASNSTDEGQEQDDEAEESPLAGAAAVGEMESILTLCEARGLGARMLEWHYRSRDPSLIRVSNREFYKDGLILPPSPLQDDPAFGLAFTRVHGVYDRGGKRDNRIEGAEIVKRVAQHAAATPQFSLGIVTFSSAQRNLVTELLEFERRRDPVLDHFLREGGSEDVFVKNIENVQGDERDIILVSVGYGPTEAGARLTSMSFGPVNNEGGERRLNVLFTRARIRCEVFASFDPGDIDDTKVSKEGPRVLKRFLEYAKTGMFHERTPDEGEPETPFEADVADSIRSLGFAVDHQIGSAGFLIDLGVRHPERPGTYVLAVECDGATYHSALWARERDRLRQSVLEHLGWRFHRIWSTDWFYRRAAEHERLMRALREAVAASDAGIRIEGANDQRPVATPPPTPAEPAVIDLPAAPERTMPPYLRSTVSVRSSVEPHEADLHLLARLAAQIVIDEGPVHEEEIARRTAAAFGRERAGSRILAATRRALALALRSQNVPIMRDGSFWFTAAQADACPVRDRSAETGPLCKASNIAMMEIGEAIRLATEDNAGGSDQEIVRAAARLLGFRRVGPDLQKRLQEALSVRRAAV